MNWGVAGKRRNGPRLRAGLSLFSGAMGIILLICSCRTQLSFQVITATMGTGFQQAPKECLTLQFTPRKEVKGADIIVGVLRKGKMFQYGFSHAPDFPDPANFVDEEETLMVMTTFHLLRIARDAIQEVLGMPSKVATIALLLPQVEPEHYSKIQVRMEIPPLGAPIPLPVPPGGILSADLAKFLHTQVHEGVELNLHFMPQLIKNPPFYEDPFNRPFGEGLAELASLRAFRKARSEGFRLQVNAYVLPLKKLVEWLPEKKVPLSLVKEGKKLRLAKWSMDASSTEDKHFFAYMGSLCLWLRMIEQGGPDLPQRFLHWVLEHPAPTRGDCARALEELAGFCPGEVSRLLEEMDLEGILDHWCTLWEIPDSLRTKLKKLALKDKDKQQGVAEQSLSRN